MTFIDTNVLVYAAAGGAPLFDRARAALARAAADGPVLISRQVLRGPSVWEQTDHVDPPLLFAGRQVHDANIVATMLAHSERRLLTFNVADFRRFALLIEVLAL